MQWDAEKWTYTREPLSHHHPPLDDSRITFLGNIFQENISPGPTQLNIITVVHISHVMLTFLLVLTFPGSIICVLYQNDFIEKDEPGFFMVFKYTEPCGTRVVCFINKKSHFFHFTGLKRDIFFNYICLLCQGLKSK